MSESRKEIKQKIKDSLPVGFQAKIKNALDGKYSISYIGQVCDPSNNRWNEEVIKIAAQIALEEKEKEDKIKEITNQL